jgi:hypothetical protein
MSAITLEPTRKGWRTSSYTVRNEACVELGATQSHILVQDSKYGHRGEQSPVFAFGPGAFSDLVARIKGGQLDRLQ